VADTKPFNWSVLKPRKGKGKKGSTGSKGNTWAQYVGTRKKR
jgi:hypothetical protein